MGADEVSNRRRKVIRCEPDIGGILCDLEFSYIDEEEDSAFKMFKPFTAWELNDDGFVYAEVSPAFVDYLNDIESEADEDAPMTLRYRSRPIMEIDDLGELTGNYDLSAYKPKLKEAFELQEKMAGVKRVTTSMLANDGEEMLA